MSGYDRIMGVVRIISLTCHHKENTCNTTLVANNNNNNNNNLFEVKLRF